MTTQQKLPRGIRQYQGLVKDIFGYFQRNVGSHVHVLDDVLRVEDISFLRQKGVDEVIGDKYPPRAIAFEPNDVYFGPGVLLACPETRLQRDLVQRIFDEHPNYKNAVIKLNDKTGQKPYFLLHNLRIIRRDGLGQYFKKELEKFLRFATETQLYFSSPDFQRSVDSLNCVADALASTAYQRIQRQAAQR